MRLLNVETYELIEIRQRPTYAILSHRWYEEEITFGSLNAAQLKNDEEQSPQLDKIRGACARAKEDGLGWVWIDSCCINKESTQEVARSINSMFQWYQEAAVCYTYLADVVSSTPGAGLFERQKTEGQLGGRYSEWFERGWTLQELLAPSRMIFFDKNWQSIGTKAELATDISRITGIGARYLTGAKDFRSASIATRLSWQAHRKTTEVEDIAYSLVGLLGVNLVPNPGEGMQAFQRLQAEIIKTQADESIFAWTAPTAGLPSHSRPWASDQWGLLALSPDCFANSRDITIDRPSKRRPAGEIATVPEGVKFPVPRNDEAVSPGWFNAVVIASSVTLIGIYFVAAYAHYWTNHHKEFSLTLNCWRKNNYGQFKAVQLFLSRDRNGDQVWRRCRCAELGSTDKVPSSRWNTVTILQPNGVNWPIES